LLITVSVAAQNSKNIIGNWEYEDVYEKSNIDAKGLEMLKMFFGEMTFEFKKDGEFNALLMGKDVTGQWEPISNTNISLKSKAGEEIAFSIVELTPEKLIMKLSKGTFIMKREDENN